jgi:uncharacterized protein (TIGR00730 family)
MMTKFVCVYCGSADGARPAHASAATALGDQLAAHGFGLVYGGARVGLMGRLADAALARGGMVVGVMPRQLARYEVEHVGLSELVWTEDLHERKRVMAERADAFVVLPGGFGTLDETLETIHMKQLSAHDKAIVLVDTEGFFASLRGLFAAVADHGFGYASARDLCRIVGDVDDVVPMLETGLTEGASR